MTLSPSNRPRPRLRAGLLPREFTSIVLIGLAAFLAASSSGGAATGFSTLHSFTGGGDGALPTAALIFDASGALYGTATAGGNSDCQISPSSRLRYRVQADFAYTLGAAPGPKACYTDFALGRHRSTSALIRMPPDPRHVRDALRHDGQRRKSELSGARIFRLSKRLRHRLQTDPARHARRRLDRNNAVRLRRRRRH